MARRRHWGDQSARLTGSAKSWQRRFRTVAYRDRREIWERENNGLFQTLVGP